MKTNKRFSYNLLFIIISVAAVLVCVFNSVGIAQARFNKSAIYSIVCGKEQVDDSTLSAEKKVFDFGFWQIGNTETFAHTVILSGESALSGKLRFVWDEITASKTDIIIIPEGGFSVSGGEYTVNEADGRLEFPFSLIFSPTQRSGMAYFDVEWIPSGSDSASLNARYLIALNPRSIAADDSGKISFESGQTGFLTNDLLQFSVSVPDNVEGAMFSVGSSILNKFNAGTVYYTETYPQGVKLLKSSILYLQKGSSGRVSGIINLEDHTTDKPVNITAGISDSNYTTTSQTPTSDSSALTVNLINEEPILSHTKPLNFTIGEPSALRDNAWNASGSTKAELAWKMERLNNGAYEDVESSKNFVVAASQDSSGGTLTVSAPTGDQPAGTYRLTVTQTLKGYLISKKTLSFYIDYR